MEGLNLQASDIQAILGSAEQMRLMVAPRVYLIVNSVEMRVRSEPNFTLGGNAIYGPAVLVRIDKKGTLVNLQPDDITSFNVLCERVHARGHL